MLGFKRMYVSIFDFTILEINLFFNYNKLRYNKIVFKHKYTYFI